jgi:H2-forming N5,N10-methylenetetrahydromethanopterin dehydrogenase-like enzyme
MICSCSNEIHPKRVEFLQKKGMKIQCIPCAEGKVVKLAGVQVISGKTERGLEICTPEQAERFEKLSRRAGTGVSQGVKMNQSFIPKIFK